MTVAVVVKGYPRLSETFIAQELLGLERRGVDLRILSLRQPTDTARHPIHAEISAPVAYLPEYLHHDPVRVLCAWRRARRFSGYAAAWAVFIADLKRDRTRNRIRRFGQACVMAAELDPSIDRIHAHFLHTPGTVARYAALLAGLPFTLSGHAKDVWTTPDWELREKLKDAAWTVTCSNAGARRLRALAPGKPPDRLYHGIDLTRFPPFERPTSWRDGTDGDNPVQLVTVCRAVDKKGLDVVLGALAVLPAETNWRLTHIGAGPVMPALKHQAETLGIAGRIAWCGAQTQTGVLAALRDADLFVIAPRVTKTGDRDGLPNVLLEAQSQGLAVIATTVSGIPELIVDDETGLLVPPDSVPALSVALQRLIRDPASRNAFGTAGARRVRTHFDCETWLDQLAARFRDPRARGRKAQAA